MIENLCIIGYHGVPPLTIQQSFDLALKHHQAGRLPDAQRLYQQILTQQPEHVGALHYLGVLEHQQGRNDAAVDLIRKAIALSPNLPEPHNNLGLALNEISQVDQAIDAYQQALALRPNYPNALYNLGIALQSKGLQDEAAVAYREAIALRPEYVEAHNNLGNALRAKGSIDDAIASYERAIALRPDFAAAEKNLHITQQEKIRNRIRHIDPNGTMLRCGGTKYVIETGDPYAFNGASILTPSGRLLIHRRGDGKENGLRYLWIDAQGGGGWLPQLRGDPRLILHDGKLLVSDNFIASHGGDRIQLHEVLIDGRDARTREIARFEHIPGLQLDRLEKNWCPFSVGGQLYFEYSVNPHIILACDLHSNSIELAFHNEAKRLPFHVEGVGPLRLSTPAVLLNDGGKGETFLGAFHAVRDGDYYSAFYQFSTRPPFEIIAISTSPVLWPEDADDISWRNLGWRILFMQSLEVDESGDRALMYGGDNDHACIRIDMKLSTILAGMAPVT